MSGDVGPVDLKKALAGQLQSQRKAVSGSAKGRRALEEIANNPRDAARLNRKAERGETVQLNVEISAKLKDELRATARDYRMTMLEIIEAALRVEIDRIKKAEKRRA